MFIPFIEEKKVISQLRLGYTLNDYRHKIGLQDSPDCNCGEIETVAHYICECEEYEKERQKLLYNSSIRQESKLSVQKSSSV